MSKEVKLAAELRSELGEQEERMTALVDLKLTRSAQETADELRRIEVAIQTLDRPTQEKQAAAAVA